MRRWCSTRSNRNRSRCGQVLVEIHCSGICGAQLNEIAGTKGPDNFLPHLLGHEGGGVVVEIGPGVPASRPGDHVVLHWRKGAGIHARPANISGTAARQLRLGHDLQPVLPSSRKTALTPIPKDVPFESRP